MFRELITRMLRRGRTAEISDQQPEKPQPKPLTKPILGARCPDCGKKKAIAVPPGKSVGEYDVCQCDFRRDLEQHGLC